MDSHISINLAQLLFSASMALDAVEHEVLGAIQNHSRRVAYISVLIGQEVGFSKEELVAIASYASLHDNALTEYITEQRRLGNTKPINEIRDGLDYHCIIGEKNLSAFPFPFKEKNVILYHHENFDGSGVFGVKGGNIPFMARILRLIDHTDVLFQLSTLTPEKIKKLKLHLEKNADILYDKSLCSVFARILDRPSLDKELSDHHIKHSLENVVPTYMTVFSYSELINISSLFSHIIDYKSPFTLNHSAGIAAKTKRMAEYYDFPTTLADKIYIAAFLHDIGKLATPDSLLEKPGKLTAEEFTIVKQHVVWTHKILREVDNFYDIERWASGHHERLDGSGYFRGCIGVEQDFCTRLLACIDIYQALVEDRPYRSGMEMDQALSILKTQADQGKLDKQIVSDIAKVFH